VSLRKHIGESSGEIIKDEKNKMITIHNSQFYNNEKIKKAI